MVLSTLFRQFSFLKKLFADSANSGPVFQDGLAVATPGLITEIARRRDRAKGFVVRPSAGSPIELESDGFALGRHGEVGPGDCGRAPHARVMEPGGNRRFRMGVD
jgi:hypothetical protein